MFSSATRVRRNACRNTYDARHIRIQEPDKVRQLLQKDYNVIATCYFRDRKDPQHHFRVPQHHKYMAPWYDSMKTKCKEHSSLRGIVFYTGLSRRFVRTYETDAIAFVKCNLGSYTTNDERFFVYYEMNQLGSPQTICVTDIRDVTINRPPHELILQYPPDMLFIGSDDTHFVQDFVDRNRKQMTGRNWHQLEKGHCDSSFRLPRDFRHQLLCNAGCIGGQPKAFCLFIEELRTFLLQLEPVQNFNMLAVNYVIFELFHHRSPTMKDRPRLHYIHGYPFTSEFKQYTKPHKTDACLIHR